MGRKGLASALGSLKARITLGGVGALVLGIGLITVLLVNRAERDVLKAQRQRELSASVSTAAVLSRRVVELQRALQVTTIQLDTETFAEKANRCCAACSPVSSWRRSTGRFACWRTLPECTTRK